MPALEPLDESFFDTAPVINSYPMDLPVSAEQVWAGLTSATPLSWCRALPKVEYTSARPFGVGTTRTATVAGGLLRLREHFFRWDEGHRKSFYVQRANLPLFRRFAEDYLVEPTPGGCRFTWTFAYEALPVTRLAKPVNTALFASLIKDTRKHFGAS